MHVARQALGWRPGMPTICVWGAQRDIGQGLTGYRRLRHDLTNRLSRLREVDGFALTDETARRVHEQLLASPGGAAIYGFSSMLDHVARVVQERGWRVPAGLVRVAWNGGEMLHDEQVSRFREVFGVPDPQLLRRPRARHDRGAARGGWSAAPRPPLPLRRAHRGRRRCRSRPDSPGRVVVTSTEGRGTPVPPLRHRRHRDV